MTEAASGIFRPRTTDDDDDESIMIINDELEFFDF
jgi:hypothetical protein